MVVVVVLNPDFALEHEKGLKNHQKLNIRLWKVGIFRSSQFFLGSLMREITYISKHKNNSRFIHIQKD